jgi:hypothetical protein
MQHLDSETQAASPKPGGGTTRHVIVHYHLFKNAGTSLDRSLKENFGNGWCGHEGSGGAWPSNEVAEFLLQHPEVTVLSSHTALLPPPSLPNTNIYPVIFLRHPLDRVRSVYEFERKQQVDNPGANMAKTTDLSGYIRWRLDRKGDRTICNFQAHRLAFAVPEHIDRERLNEEARASVAVKELPFVGVVEHFDRSLQALQRWLRPVFPGIELLPRRVNVTQSQGVPLLERIEQMRVLIGDELYNELAMRNQLDLMLHSWASTSRLSA